MSPSEKRVARDAVREGDKVRRRAVQQVTLAGWSDEDADESNWLYEAVRAHPDPDFAVDFVYGVARRLVDHLADATGEDREQVMKDVCVGNIRF